RLYHGATGALQSFPPAASPPSASLPGSQSHVDRVAGRLPVEPVLADRSPESQRRRLLMRRFPSGPEVIAVTADRVVGRRSFLRRAALRAATVGMVVLFPVASTFGQAALPSIGSLSPQAVHPGQTVDVKLRGGNLASPTQLWTTSNGEVPLAADVAGNGTNAA